MTERKTRVKNPAAIASFNQDRAREIHRRFQNMAAKALKGLV